MDEPIRDVVYREEQMYAIWEMQIIYAYKHLEINIKKLLNIAYNYQKQNLYKFDILESFLKRKGINIKDLPYRINYNN